MYLSCFLLIFSCKRYHHKRTYQKNTWLKQITLLPFAHVIGDETLSTPFHWNESERLLTVRWNDTYEKLPGKVIAAFHAILILFPEVAYIFKTDDDQQPKPNRISFFNALANRLLNQNKRFHYGGQAITIQAHKSQYHRIHPELPSDLPLEATTYCTGRFYFLSKEAIELLDPEKIQQEWFEDYAIGKYMDSGLKQDLLHFDTTYMLEDATDFNLHT